MFLGNTYFVCTCDILSHVTQPLTTGYDNYMDLNQVVCNCLHGSVK